METAQVLEESYAIAWLQSIAIMEKRKTTQAVKSTPRSN
jgi:hypothetical protein